MFTPENSQEHEITLVRRILKECGIPSHRLHKLDGKTKIYHDLGIYGDVAESLIEILAKEHEVSMTDFVRERYFPPEFPGGTQMERVIFWGLPGMYRFLRGSLYQPLHVRDLMDAISRKHLDPA